jgi:hypothetical protein
VTRFLRRLAILASVLAVWACTAAPAPIAPAPSTVPAPPTVTSRPWPSAADLETIREVIESRATGQLSSIGIGNRTVDVVLRASAVGLAKEIVDAYGDAVHVTVGFFSYPSSEVAGGACPVQGTFAVHPALRASLQMATPRIPAGATLDSTVRIANIGATPVRLDTSSGLRVYLFQAGGTTPVGTSDGGSAGTGLLATVEPGTSITIPGDGGTASCDLTLGYTLAAGPYQARSLVDYAIGPEGGNGPLVFWSDALDVEIVAEP